VLRRDLLADIRFGVVKGGQAVEEDDLGVARLTNEVHGDAVLLKLGYAFGEFRLLAH
jgi:hypothetical protein